MEIKRYCVVSSVGVVFEEYGFMSDYASAVKALRQACAAHPLAGCRLLFQRLELADGDSMIERRNGFLRRMQFFRR